MVAEKLRRRDFLRPQTTEKRIKKKCPRESRFAIIICRTTLLSHDASSYVYMHKQKGEPMMQSLQWCMILLTTHLLVRFLKDYPRLPTTHYTSLASWSCIVLFDPNHQTPQEDDMYGTPQVCVYGAHDYQPCLLLLAKKEVNTTISKRVRTVSQKSGTARKCSSIWSSDMASSSSGAGLWVNKSVFNPKEWLRPGALGGFHDQQLTSCHY
jgi:hypothetical protein